MNDFEEFINRAKEFFKDADPAKHHRERARKQQQTEKGKEALRRGWKKRNELMKKAKEGTDWQEKKLIKKFYRDCPEGYEIDHIIPISQGGKHCLSNLQYLTRALNKAKFTKTKLHPFYFNKGYEE